MRAARRLTVRAPAPTRATYRRPHGVQHLLAAHGLKRDRLYRHHRRRGVAAGRRRGGCERAIAADHAALVAVIGVSLR
jgi:hypothetical protein